MNVTMTGRHIEMTDALKAYIQSGLEKVASNYEKNFDADVVLDVEMHRHIAEVNVLSNGVRIIHSKEASSDMYASLDAVMVKLDKKIRELKDSINRRQLSMARETSETSLSESKEPDTGIPCEDENTLWTSAMNQRRCQLVDKDIDATISEEERSELTCLQSDFVAYRQKVAPLPLDDLRKLHQDLLEKATKAEFG